MPKRVQARSFAKEEPALVAETDWRLVASTWITQPAVVNGHEFPVGTVVKRHASVEISPNSVLHFGTPSVPALLLDQAARLDIQARDLLPVSLSFLGAEDNIRDFQVFEYLENRMASIVFSHTALEAFANDVISRGYAAGYRYEQKRKGRLIASLDLATIERHVALDEKLSGPLPELFGIKSPKGRHEWNSYIRLKRIRDRVIHCKPKDLGDSRSADDTLWRALLKRPMISWAFETYRLIGYFYEAKPVEMPRWYANWPYAEPVDR